MADWTGKNNKDARYLYHAPSSHTWSLLLLLFVRACVRACVRATDLSHVQRYRLMVQSRMFITVAALFLIDSSLILML